MWREPATRRWVVPAALLVGTASARADFQPPKDGKLSEKQVTAAIAVLKDQMDTLRSTEKATAGSQSSAANLALVMRASQKLDAAAAKQGLSSDEYNWISNQIQQLWPIATLQQQWDDSGKPDLERQLKAKQDEMAAATAKQAEYEKAARDGRRILTAEQRTSAVQSATGDRDSAAGDVKSAQDALAQIQAEVKQHDKEAADADALAKSPPADVSADDRAGYVDGKKAEAQAARDAAKESRDKLPDAQKAVTDAKAKLAVLEGKVAHPEVPTTDDEKAQVKQENEQAIADGKSTVDGDKQAIDVLKETLAAGPPGMNVDPKPDPDNLALVKKHIKEYWAAIGMPDPSQKK